MKKIFGSFSDLENIMSEFQVEEKDRISEEELVFAAYGEANYEGDAKVIFQKEGKLYEVSGSHCSCRGLEG